MANLLFVSVTATLVLFVAHQVCTNPGSRRPLTAEEEALADEARSTIVKVLEKNLIKFFTLVAADDGRGTFGRQDEEDDDDSVPTLNPQILPQVAQILGAIFAGNLNLSAVVDRSVTLVPQVLRNQIDGVFKLFTGQPPPTLPPNLVLTPKPKRKSTTQQTTAETVDEMMTTTTVTTATEEKDTDVRATTKASGKSRNRNRTTVKPDDVDFFEEDDELFRLQEELITAAHDAEPYVKDKQPRFFISSFGQILNNLDNGRLNITQIVKFLPDLFQGARHAFALLENLGTLAGIDLEDYES